MSQVDYTKPLELNRPGYRDVTYKGVFPDDPDRSYISAKDRNGHDNTLTIMTESGIFTDYRNNDNPLRVRNASETEIQEVFNVHCGQDSWAKANWKQLPPDRYELPDAKEAAKVMKELNAKSKASGSDWRFMLKKRIENASATDWESWIAARFESGEYTKVVWADEPWANKYPQHHVRNSRENPDYLAFTATEDKGLADRAEQMTPGRYLTAYYSDVLTQDEIATWTAKFDTESELEFGDTPEYFANGYKAAYLGSCMGYSIGHFGGTHHPTEIYGAGDLALALLKRRGALTGRAIVHKEKKLWIRIYGDSRRMADRLTAEGYKPASPRHLEGVRLLRIPARLEGKNAVVMPYLDLSMHAAPHPTDENLLVMTRRGNIAGNQHRYGRVVPGNAAAPTPCGRCSNYVQEPQTAPFVAGGYNRIWCEPCATAYTCKCDYTGDYYSSNDTTFYPVNVYDARTNERVKYISPAYADEFADQVQMVHGQYYLTETLAYNSQTKVWSLPEPVVEAKPKAVRKRKAA